MNKRKIRNDIILALSVLTFAAAALIIFHSCSSGGKTVNVVINGDVLKSYSLSEDARATISTGDSSSGVNVLVIKDGKVYVESANCRDQICVEHAPISKSGETIVCLPHSVVIEIE